MQNKDIDARIGKNAVLRELFSCSEKTGAFKHQKVVSFLNQSLL